MDKINKCCWKGFDHEQNEGLWNHQYEQNNYILEVAPHATMALAVIIADEKGEYVCYAGTVSYTQLTLPTICSV